MDKQSGRLATGLFWGIVFSVPLWMSVIGWVRLVRSLL